MSVGQSILWQNDTSHHQKALTRTRTCFKRRTLDSAKGEVVLGEGWAEQAFQKN